MSAFTASGRSSCAPLLATMTGSTTNRSIRCVLTFSATTSMIAAMESIPVLAASMAISSRTESIWRPTNSGGKRARISLDAHSVLGRHRRDRRGAEDTQGGEGFQIGLDPRAAAGIESRR